MRVSISDTIRDIDLRNDKIKVAKDSATAAVVVGSKLDKTVEIESIEVLGERPYPPDPTTLYLEYDITQDYTSQTVWRNGSLAEPIIEGGEVTDRFPNDPNVFWDGSQYVMYVGSSKTTAQMLPPIVPFRMVSADGITGWTFNPSTPLIDPDDSPFMNNETPNVIYFGGEYHMYYTGVYASGVPPMAIGHATSPDGIVWTNDPTPVLEATGVTTDWNGYLVAEPGAIVKDGQVWLYFAAMEARTVEGEPPQRQSIGVAVSADGTNFGTQYNVLLPHLIGNWPASDGFVGYSTPCATLHEGKVHLVCDVAAYIENNPPGRQWHQVALIHAVSDDGVNGFVEDDDPMLLRSDFWWCSGEILGPSILIKDNMIKLWFSGHVDTNGLLPFVLNGWAGPEHGIGYAEIPLTNWTT